MSNNIIDTVTQAVNSLVSALKLPDESAKANDTLGSMNSPSSAVFCPIRIMIPRPVCLLITKPSVLCLRRVLYPVRIKVSSPHWSIYCAANFPGASRSVFIWSPANWSAMISTMVCVNSAGVVNRLRSLTPLPRPTTSGQRRRSSPCLLIWICPHAA